MSGRKGKLLRKSVTKSGGSLITRRGFIAGLVGATGAIALTGRPAVSASPKVTLRYQEWKLAEEPTGAGYRQLIGEFEKANPDIKVEMEPVPYGQSTTRFVTQAKANQQADVIGVLDPSMQSFINNDYLLDLTPFVQKAGGKAYLDNFYPVTVDVAGKDGKIFAIPVYHHALLLHYNTEMFKEVGLDPAKPPRTWAEQLEVAKKLTKSDGTRFGIAICGAKQESAVLRFMSWLYNNDADVLSADMTRSVLNEGKAVEALDWWSSLFTKHGVVPPGPTEVGAGNARSLLAQERVAMIQGYHIGADLVPSENPKMRERQAFATLPTNNGKIGATPITVALLGIGSNTKFKDEAWRLVEFLASKDSQVTMNKVARQGPARKDAVGALDLSRDPYTKANVDALPHARVYPHIPQWPQIADLIAQAFQEALTKAKTPKDAFADASRKIDSLLKR